MRDEVIRILQLIPAEGWWAHYKNDAGSDTLESVVCFALVEVTEHGEKRQEVRPMSSSPAGIEFCQGKSNFSDISLGK
jgi:hypothetical protein